MQRRLLLGHPQLAITIGRLCQELIENHQNFENTVLLGMQPRGILFADRIAERLEGFLGHVDEQNKRSDGCKIHVEIRGRLHFIHGY